MHGMSSPMPGMASEQEMVGLKSSTGVDFDRMFARMMIVHHDGAIRMARDEQAAEVQKLQSILDRL